MGYGRYGLSLPDPATSATSYSLTALSQGWARGAAFGLLAQPNGAKTGPCTDTPQAWTKLRGRFATCAAPLALRAHRQPEPRRLSRLGPGLHRPATARAATATAATARSATAKSATRLATRSSDRQPPDAEGSMARRHTFSRSVVDNSFEQSCGIRGNIWFGIQKYSFSN